MFPKQVFVPTLPSPGIRDRSRDGAIFHKWNTSWCTKDHYIWFIDMRKIDEIPEIWTKWFSEQTMADLRFRLQKWQRFQDGFSEKLQSARKAFEEKSYHWVLKNN